MRTEHKTRSILLKAPPGESQRTVSVILNRTRLKQLLEEVIAQSDLATIKRRALLIKQIISSRIPDQEALLNIDSDGETISLRSDVLISELDQVLASQTSQRATYYLRRLLQGIERVRTSKVNDINLLRWKEYDHIITDSLWLLDKRDSSGAHLAWYWGNFVPQIPRQMMLRYTKKGDWVLDTFVGSGTTLIECRRLGRNGIGIELNHEVLEKAKQLLENEPNKHNVTTDLVAGDARTIDLASVLGRYGISKVQLLIMHPPYHDIIRFSEDKRDLSNATSTDEFLGMFRQAVANAGAYVQPGRYLALVIGDKYSKGQWVPLGFYCMQEVLAQGYLLKSIVVKNFQQTRGKRNQEDLWRYRALVGGFYVFKHEYIMVFKRASS